MFRIQYHSIDEIDCLIDTFPFGTIRRPSVWCTRATVASPPFMSLTVEATVTIVVPDN